MSKNINQEIAQYLLDNPKAFIAYWDNGSWEIYPHKPKGLEDGDIQLKPLYEGDDSSSLNGYIPTLVDIMALALKIKVWSI